MKSSDEEKELRKIFRIFDNNHRLSILRLLKMKRELSVGQIADHLEVPFNTISKNVLLLAKSGILARRYDTPFVLYKISNSAPAQAKIILSHLI